MIFLFALPDMRRLVIEADAYEFARLTGDKLIEKIKALEVLHFIKQDPDEFILICSIEFNDPSTRLDDIFKEPESRLEVLDEYEEGKSLVLVKSKPENDPTAQAFWAVGGYMVTPFEIKNGKVKLTFLGTAKQVRVIPEMMRNAGLRYRVLQLSNANLPPSSPISELTEKQRKVLTTAFNLGYYDLPRKISSKQLAAKLKIGSSDFIKHRRKAERRVLSSVLSAT